MRSRSRCGGAALVAAAALLTAVVQHFALLSGEGNGSACGGDAIKTGALDAAAATQPVRPDTTDEWDSPGCMVPAFNESSLAHHRCHLETNICIDQGRFVSWAPHWQPGAVNFSGTPWRFDNAPTAIPGHYDALQGPYQIHYCQPQPRFRPPAAAQEQPDIAAPRFSRCTVPVLFWPYWHMNMYEFLADTLEPLWRMTLHSGSPAPLLLDRKASLTPVIDGFTLPEFYHWLLFPFSQRPVEELHELSARRHARAPRRSRCFHRLVLCALHNSMSPPPRVSHKDFKASMRPAAAGQTVVDFYRRRYPQRFRQRRPKDVLQVLFIHRAHTSRRLLNMDQLLALCNGWVPTAGGYRAAACRPHEFRDAAFLDDLALLQRTHVLVGLHGAMLIYGVLLPPGSALVEIRPHGFEGWWPNTYGQTTFNLEKVIRFFYMHTADVNSQPGEWEKRGPGTPRDRNTVVDWSKLVKILDDAASGKPGYAKAMSAEEAPHFTDNDD